MSDREMSAEEFVAAYRKKYPDHKVPEPKKPEKILRRAFWSVLLLPILMPCWFLIFLGYGAAKVSLFLTERLLSDQKERAK